MISTLDQVTGHFFSFHSNLYQQNVHIAFPSKTASCAIFHEHFHVHTKRQ